MIVPLQTFTCSIPCSIARRAFLVMAISLLLGLSGVSVGQTEEAFGDAGADPVKLFEQGQNAHGRGELLKALEFYEQALRVRPDFPEAEFQRSNVLMTLGRLPEAESGFRRAIELRKDWSLPYSGLGALLAGLNRDAEAESLLRQAVKLDPQSSVALRLLAEIRLHAGDTKDALELARRATKDPDAPVATWLLRARAERASGDNTSALASLDHMLQLEPLKLSALIERAEILIAAGKKELAIADLVSAEPLVKSERSSASRMAAAYEAVGKPEDARRIAEAAGLISSAALSSNTGDKVAGTPSEIEAANSDDPETSRKALEQLLTKNPRSAMLLARLGDSYRKTDPARSLDYYRRALEIDPRNADYATGYSSALVQARRFNDAVVVLRRVLAASPDNFAAHANLATALYAMKHYAEALAEYEWILKTKPDLLITHYFVGSAHDNLGEYEQALASYELFLAGADQKANQLEIEKVKLRLPLLRRQIQLGQGVKRKPAQTRKN